MDQQEIFPSSPRCVFVEASSLEKGTARNIIIYEDKIWKDKNLIPTLTQSNIQSLGELLEEERTKRRRRTAPQEVLNCIETLLIPRKLLSREKSERQVVYNALKPVDEASVVVGEVDDASGDGTLILQTVSKKAKELRATKSPTFTEATHIASSTKWTNETDDWQRHENNRHRHKYAFLSKLIPKPLIGRRKQNQWLRSLREPHKNNGSMEMIFFDQLPFEEPSQPSSNTCFWFPHTGRKRGGMSSKYRRD